MVNKFNQITTVFS